MKSLSLKTTGMECTACEQRIEAAVKKLDGVQSVKSNYADETTVIEYDEEIINDKKIRDTIKKLGYGSDPVSKVKINGANTSGKFGNLAIALGVFTILASVYFLLRGNFDFGVDFTNISTETGIATLFLIGFLTGFHCIGMCGGFVLSYSKNIKHGGDLIPHLLYGSGKTISYAVIGALFGLIGSFIAFTIELRASVAILAGIFLVIYGLNMLNIFPILRKLQLRMPSFIKPGQGRHHGPLVTGLLNGLMIACGPLQALYIFAAGTGSPVAGAQALFFFGLGTLAPLLTFGIASNFLSSTFSHNVVKFSGILVIILGLVMASNGLNLLGVGLPALTSASPAPGDSIVVDAPIVDAEGYQVIKMDVTSYGWSPNSFVIKKGVPVRWEINGVDLNGCNNEIIVREYGLDIKLKKGIQVIEFTPDREGTVRWSCWMGMIPGQFVVVENVDTVTPEIIPSIAAGSSCGGGSGGCGCGG
ncbi:sulfite exporter TauE/SafE family protein [Candidatus Micrarchaeota archaeon]|nr:sulfite exporter TauE/SafE family protein [Candidatus Micrarchaeota archaeon]